MNPHEASFWNGYLAKVWRKGHETLRKGLIPVLNGDAESVPKSVANYRDEERKKATVVGRCFDGIKRPPASDSELSESFRDEADASEDEADCELVPKAIHPDTQAIHDNISHKIATPEDNMADRELGAQAYNCALSHFGDRGVKFLNELIASNGNVKAASEAAGVSRVTGHKWRTKLEIIRPKKNPTK